MKSDSYGSHGYEPRKTSQELLENVRGVCMTRINYAVANGQNMMIRQLGPEVAHTGGSEQTSAELTITHTGGSSEGRVNHTNEVTSESDQNILNTQQQDPETLLKYIESIHSHGA